MNSPSIHKDTVTVPHSICITDGCDAKILPNTVYCPTHRALKEYGDTVLVEIRLIDGDWQWAGRLNQAQLRKLCDYATELSDEG